MSDVTKVSRTLMILNKKGLHARAAAKFVKCADVYDATVEVSKDGTTVMGTSIMGLLMLGASIGTRIDVVVEGPQAEAVLAALAGLVAAKFHEEQDEG